MPHLYKDVEGWFTFQTLYDQMIEKYNNEDPVWFAEIGCWYGKSSTYLLEKIKELDANIWVEFVDSWIGGEGEPERNVVLENGFHYVYEKFFYNILKTKNPRYNITREFSNIAPKTLNDECFSFIFIDAGHQGWQAYDDLSAWYPKLRQSGTIAGHDSDYPDVLRSVERFCQENGLSYRISPSPQHCWIIEK